MAGASASATLRTSASVDDPSMGAGSAHASVAPLLLQLPPLLLMLPSLGFVAWGPSKLLLAALSLARMRARVGMLLLLMSSCVPAAAVVDSAFGRGLAREETAAFGDEALVVAVLGTEGCAAAARSKARAAMIVRTRTGSSLLGGWECAEGGVCWISIRGGKGVGSMGQPAAWSCDVGDRGACCCSPLFLVSVSKWDCHRG